MGVPYCPRRGDLVWLTFTPQAGHEQAGHRPALTLSPATYNRKAGLALFCPVTSRAKGHPFEVPLSAGLPVAGVLLADQVKSLDWQARRAEFCCVLPEETLREVMGRIAALLEEE